MAMIAIPDVDLDVSDRPAALALFDGAVIASQMAHDRAALIPHNTGLYMQNIPRDPFNGLAVFPYGMAEDFGFYKIDIIKNGAYDGVLDEEHLQMLIDRAESDGFPWHWFQEERFFTNPDTSLQVTHLANHFAICQKYPPESVMDVAILNALIRPRKKYLDGQPWEVIEEKIWQKLPEEETGDARSYYFKKSHAVAFALLILVHLQILDAVLTDTVTTDGD